MNGRPRVLFVGRGPYRLPLDPGLARRFAALDRELEWRQLGARDPASHDSDPRFALPRRFPIGALDGVVWHLALPFRVARELRRLEPDVAVVQGAPETALALWGRSLARSRTAIVLDVHGDWRAPTRLYGSRLRRLLDPLSDVLARRALRGADAVRTITAYTSELVRAEGVEPVAEFPAYMDLEAFAARPVEPLPEASRALFLGALERTKGFDVLADAWRLVAEELPDAELHVLGRGALASRAASLAAERPGRVRFTSETLSAGELAAAMDDATVLVLPSRSEGMGRVVVEAGLRGRGAVASRVGGIPEVAVEGRSAVLVEPGDARELASALVRVLGDRELAQRLGAAARAEAEARVVSPEEYARRIRALVDATLARRAA